MSSHHSKIQVEETGIECSPDGIAKGCAGCITFLISLVMIGSLGVIAGGAFWSARSLDRLVSGNSHLTLKSCNVTTCPIVSLN